MDLEAQRYYGTVSRGRRYGVGPASKAALVAMGVEAARNAYNSYSNFRVKKRRRSSSSYKPKSNARVRMTRGGVLRKTRKAKRRRRVRRRKKSLRKRISQVEKLIPQKSIKKVRQRSYEVVNCGVNECKYNTIPMWLESNFLAHMTDLVTLDRTAGPGTIDIAIDLSKNSSGLNSTLYFKNRFFRVNLSNNYGLPCKVSVYWCQAKTGNNNNMGTVVAGDSTKEGIADFSTNALTFPSDVRSFRKHYKLIKTDKASIQPGDDFESSYAAPDVKLNPKDDEWSYPPGTIFAMVRVEGFTGHYSVALPTDTDLCQTPVSLDVKYDRNFDITYDGDIPYWNSKADHNGAATGTLPIVRTGATVEVLDLSET